MNDSQIDYSNKKILFTAFSVAEGSEELAGYEFIKRHGASDISALYWGGDKQAQQIPDDVKKIEIAGNNQFDPEITAGYDLVFRHQTTRPELIKSPTTTNTNEFFKYCRAPIIAVTGTKGKGTTSTLISRILDEADVNNVLVGNMGLTAIERIDEIKSDDVVVFEISSFQLWDLETSPHVAVVLMMDVDHQDVHASVEEYIEAKSNIVRHQQSDDIVIYHPNNKMTAKVVGVPRGRSKRFLSEEGAHIIDKKIFIDGAEIMWVEQVGLRGSHNLENICAAITAAWEFTQDVSAISNAVAAFSGLEHRLEHVAKIDGIDYFDDSFSVVPVATEAAIASFDQPIVLIMGGYDRGADFSDVAESIRNSKVADVILIGDTRHEIAETLSAAGYEQYEIIDSKDMSQIVSAAKKAAVVGYVVLFSPGCASFDMFDNYKVRGNEFKRVVKSGQI